MDIEKTYELMNELQIFKNLLKSTQELEPKLNKNIYQYYFGISSNIMNELMYEKRNLINEEIKNILIPVFQLKIEQLEEEIKTK